ncbi:hypothetical protein [Schlesneria paludicola]|uniref:hypothetical protein n=1 Tax=Schlesneria paludicola TaxID=360056 RepID=UPI00029ABE75|nr:hypothetical protein [Schlesneria paludicola]
MSKSEAIRHPHPRRATQFDAFDDSYGPRRTDPHLAEYEGRGTRIPNDWDDGSQRPPYRPNSDSLIRQEENEAEDPISPLELPEQSNLNRIEQPSKCDHAAHALLMKRIGMILLLIGVLLGTGYVIWLAASRRTGRPVIPSADHSIRRSLEEIEFAVYEISTRLPQPADIDEFRNAISTQIKIVRSEIDKLNSAVELLGKPLSAQDLNPVVSKADEIGSKVDLIFLELQKACEKWSPCPENTAATPMSLDSVSPLLSPLAERLNRRTPADYRAVDEVLTGLRLLNPQDARIWYLSALARGYLTNQFDTEELKNWTNFGAHLERMGQPTKKDVDDSFARFKLPPDAMLWLSQFRKE